MIALLLLLLNFSSAQQPLVFLLAGQSNMDGAARVDSAHISYFQLPEGIEFWENGKKLDNPAENKRIGPEYSIALELKLLYPTREIILVKRAVGGVSLYAWSPYWTKEKADSTKNAWAGNLYQSLLNDVKKATEGKEPEFGGLFWMQGERDSKFEFAADSYFENLYELVLHFRNETRPNLPFVFGKVNPPAVDHYFVNKVRKAQQKFAQEDVNAALVDSDDLSKESDVLHYNLKGQIELGKRMVAALDSLNQQKIANWHGNGTPVSYLSQADQSLQKAMMFKASGTEKRPLVMVIHTWRGDWKQAEGEEFLALAKERNWNFIHPDNRGQNDKPESVGSEMVMKDMKSAVDYMVQSGLVDTSAIFLVGASGGGFASLNGAARIDIPWKAVSAWVPISDLSAWHGQSEKLKQPYAKLLEQATGGKPGDSYDIDAEYSLRSPLTYLKKFKPTFPIHINVGIEDGHSGSVPISQTLNAYNALADKEDQFTEEEIVSLTENKVIPNSLKKYKVKKEMYGKWNVLLRRASGNVTVTIFDGGHNNDARSAFKWLDAQLGK